MENRSRGRPKGKTKVNRIVVLLSDVENRAVDYIAKRAGVPSSVWFRNMLIVEMAKPKVAKAVAQISEWPRFYAAHPDYDPIYRKPTIAEMQAERDAAKESALSAADPYSPENYDPTTDPAYETPEQEAASIAAKRQPAACPLTSEAESALEQLEQIMARGRSEQAERDAGRVAEKPTP